MPIPRSFSGPTQLLGLEMDRREAARALIALPPEPGLPALFAPSIPHLALHYLDYAVYRRDRDAVAVRSGDGVALTFSDRWEAQDPAPDLAVLFIPKEKDLAAYALSELRRVLPGGTPVLLVGPKRGGIGSVAPLVERYLGEVGPRRSARHSVLVETTAGGDREPFDGRRQFSAPVAGRTLEVVSYPGVFSHGELDPGTELLLGRLSAAPVQRALDWGCGCGVLGAALRLLHPGARVDLVDFHAMALRASRETLAANGLSPEGVTVSDGLSEAGEGYDLIVSNPPFHKGVQTAFGATEAFLREAAARLSPEGRLVIVTNAFINYFPVLREVFQVVAVPVETPRYRVIEARGG
jgi:16S rRNA (guanine1207-N2)-methyltransferase